MILASIPSPSQGVWYVGPIPIRAYALCIIVGIIIAVWVGNRRWVARGGPPGAVADIAVWAVPFGLVGARLYHVITDYELYFLPGRDPWRAFAVWEGGLGIWGGVALGALGAWIGCRRRGFRIAAMADSIAPGLVLAQAMGRWGNWFNQELFGKPTTLPWGLKIDPANRPEGFEQYATFHPTFLYECVWDVGTALAVIWADRRFRLGHGRAFFAYVALYTLGRGWVEYLRIDPANHILGLRLNDWTSIFVFAGAVVAFVISARRHPGRGSVLDPARVPEGSDDLSGGRSPTDESDETAGQVNAPEGRADAAGAQPSEHGEGAACDRAPPDRAPLDRANRPPERPESSGTATTGGDD